MAQRNSVRDVADRDRSILQAREDQRQVNERIARKKRKMNTGDLEIRTRTEETGRAARPRNSALGVLAPYKYLIGDTPSEKTLTASYAVREMNNTEDKQMLSVAYAGLLISINPDLAPYLTNALANIGVGLEPVNVTTEIDKMGVLFDPTVPEPLPTCSTIMVWLSCCVLVLFKNVGDVNYVNYMAARLRAVRAKVGSAEEREGQNPFTLARAKIINRVFGSNRELKKAVLIFLMDHMEYELPIGPVAAYLADILSWNEMSSLKFIHDELMVPESPVLASPSVSHEVRRLRSAFEKIFDSVYPQYYRYFAPAKEIHLLFKRNFPILCMVAQRVKAERSGQRHVENYVTSTIVGNQWPLVEQLKKLHMDYLDNVVLLSQMNDFIRLTDMRSESDDEEEVGFDYDL